VEEVAFFIETDAREGSNGYQDWYSTLKNKFTKKAMKAAATEVDEKWLVWKANQLNRLAESYKEDMAARTKEEGKDYLIALAERLGLQVVRKGQLDTPTPPAGRKHTASGSRPKPAPQSTPTPALIPLRLTPTQTTPTPALIPLPSTPTQITPKATRVNPLQAAKKNTSTSSAPRGRDPTPKPLPPARVDPSPTPRQKKTPVAPARASPEENAVALTNTVLTKILARLEALEKCSMPPPVSQPEKRDRLTPAQSALREETSEIPCELPITVEEEGDYTVVAQNGKGKKGKGKSSPPQTNLTPASYASAASSAANTKQPTTPPTAAA
jgi:hypothetical protein